jgi:hypothetical protein
MTSVSKTTKTKSESYSSMDGTLSLGAGVAYSLSRLDFILGVNYLMAFEQVTGNFLVISAGAAYRL